LGQIWGGNNFFCCHLAVPMTSCWGPRCMP
jgi:hypothetical protein